MQYPSSLKVVTNVSQFPGLDKKLDMLNLSNIAFLPKITICSNRHVSPWLWKTAKSYHVIDENDVIYYVDHIIYISNFTKQLKVCIRNIASQASTPSWSPFCPSFITETLTKPWKRNWKNMTIFQWINWRSKLFR